MFCKHKWVVIDKAVMGPAWNDFTPELKASLERCHECARKWMFGQTHVVVVQCTECRKLKREVTLHLDSSW